jgi:hypothetical protein
LGYYLARRKWLHYVFVELHPYYIATGCNRNLVIYKIINTRSGEKVGHIGT